MIVESSHFPWRGWFPHDHVNLPDSPYFQYKWENPCRFRAISINQPVMSKFDPTKADIDVLWFLSDISKIRVPLNRNKILHFNQKKHWKWRYLSPNTCLFSFFSLFNQWHRTKEIPEAPGRSYELQLHAKDDWIQERDIDNSLY